VESSGNAPFDLATGVSPRFPPRRLNSQPIASAARSSALRPPPRSRLDVCAGSTVSSARLKGLQAPAVVGDLAVSGDEPRC
jgi:hypothetical protein